MGTEGDVSSGTFLEALSMNFQKTSWYRSGAPDYLAHLRLASEAKVPKETACNEAVSEALIKGQVPFWEDWGVVRIIWSEFSLWNVGHLKMWFSIRTFPHPVPPLYLKDSGLEALHTLPSLGTVEGGSNSQGGQKMLVAMMGNIDCQLSRIEETTPWVCHL